MYKVKATHVKNNRLKTEDRRESKGNFKLAKEHEQCTLLKSWANVFTNGRHVRKHTEICTTIGDKWVNRECGYY